jgi:hypothetical protein
MGASAAQDTTQELQRTVIVDTHVVRRSSPRLSTSTLPSGGICDNGRRDFTRLTIALDSG